MVVRLFTETENAFNAVERVSHYADVEQEAPDIMPDNRPSPEWPQKGQVVMNVRCSLAQIDHDHLL